MARSVTVVAVALSAVGAADFILSLSHNASYFQLLKYGPVQVRYFESYPLFDASVWAVGVWAGLLGAILLILSPARAALLLAVSVAGQVCLMAFTFGLRHRWTVFGAGQAIQSALITGLTLCLAVYAYRQSRRDGDA
jgi:hypothetical protein